MANHRGTRCAEWPATYGEVLACVLVAALVLSGFELLPRTASEVVPAQSSTTTTPEVGPEGPSLAVRLVADWVMATNDSGRSPFVIVDKVAARIHVLDENGRIRGSAPVLLGSARGDDSVLGIGERPIEKVLPEERTTPAGRFVGEPGRNARGEDVVWVDYDAAVSIHRVLTTNPSEHRLERLASPSVDDNRISYGCINVPSDFYETELRPVFAGHRAVIYILPEDRSPAAVFSLNRAT